MSNRSEPPKFCRDSLESGIRRNSAKNLTKATTVVDSLDDIVGSTRLWAKLHAGQVPEMFCILAVSDMAVAIEYLVTGSAVVLRQQTRQITALLGEARDVLAPAKLLQIVEVD